MLVRVKNGKIAYCYDNGTIERRYETDVVDAFLSSDGKRVLATYKNGKVKILNSTAGTVERCIVYENAVRAVFQGDDIFVTLKNGHIQVRNSVGNLLRVIF